MTKTRTNKERCDVVLLVDVETVDEGADGRYHPEPDGMEAAVYARLEERWGQVTIVPFETEVGATVARLAALKPRLVFNLTEWIDGDRCLDAAIAGLLDALKLRYTGTGPVGLHLARDKALSKALVANLGIAVPRSVIINGGRATAGDLRYPLIVKPQFGDGSDEIGKNALVRTPLEFTRRVRDVRKRVKTPLLVEEYAPGTDLFVGLIGNRPRVLAPLELVVGRQGRGAPTIATSRIKIDAAYRERWDISYRTAKLPAKVLKTIERSSAAIFRALKLRDYARLDYRLTPDNELVFLEANPNPDLSPHTFGENRCFAGVGYGELIDTIVRSAFARPR